MANATRHALAGLLERWRFDPDVSYSVEASRSDFFDCAAAVLVVRRGDFGRNANRTVARKVATVVSHSADLCLRLHGRLRGLENRPALPFAQRCAGAVLP